MDISRNNYESWFLDYFDGKLDARQQETLMSFLDFNPDLKVELEAIKDVKLKTGGQEYDLKYCLRKPTDNPEIREIDLHFENYCVASIEMQLSPNEEELLSRLAEKDQERQKIYTLYSATRLRADGTIVLPWKSRLKKTYIDIPAVRISIAGAAAIAIIMFAFSWFMKDQTNDFTPEQAVTENQPKIPDIPVGNMEGSIIDFTDVREMVYENSGPLIEKETQDRPETEFQSLVKENIRLERLESKQASRIETPVNAIPGFLASRLRNKGFQYNSSGEAGIFEDKESIPEETTGKNPFFWRLADAGIQKINETSEENYSLDRIIDEEGKIRRLTFETPLFGISAPLQNANDSR